MAFTSLDPTQTDAKSPIDEQLMDLIRTNLDDLDGRMQIVEATAGGGGGDVGGIGEVLADGDSFTNEGRFWRRRFHASISSLNSAEADIEGKNRNDRILFWQTNEDIFNLSANTDHYLGEAWILAAGKSFAFKIKKGENHFGLSANYFPTASSSVTVKIDGQSITTAGLYDETGSARGDTFSTAAAANRFQETEWFFGLDGEEHVVTVENTDGSNGYYFDSFIVGFASRTFTLDNKLKVNAGRARVRGAEADVSQTEITFSKSTGYGHTGAVVVSQLGVVEALDGLEPAQTQCKPEEEVDFSTAVTTLEVKNATHFPDTGIGVLSTCFGSHHMFSWSSKTTSSIQSHTLNGIILESQPQTTITPLDAFTGAVGESIGDINLTYWASAPLVISASNNKIDFAITKNGTRTVHAATLANGAYSADLVSFEKAFKVAMTAANDLGDYGEYFAEWDEQSHRWTLGVKSPEVSKIEFLFNSGANFATSVHGDLGFDDADTDSALSYLASNDTEHKAARVFHIDDEYRLADHPMYKYSWSGNITPDDEINDVISRLGINNFRSKAGQALFIAHPDHDSSGMILNFASKWNTAQIVYQVDDGQWVYALQPDATFQGAGDPIKAKTMSCIIAYPKGSRQIRVFMMQNAVNWEVSNDSEAIFFLGGRQLFTRPPLEQLPLDKAAVKAIEVWPLQQYETIYDNTYSPVGTNDNVNSVSETGTWTTAGDTSSYLADRRQTTVINDTVEIEFDIVGTGAFKMNMYTFSSSSVKVGVFLTTGVINEATDRVQNLYTEIGSNFPNIGGLHLQGLPAGTYKVRFKNEDGNTFSYYYYSVVDSVQPEENVNVMSDITNAGQAIPKALNVIRHKVQQDSEQKVPTWLQRTNYKFGRGAHVDYSVSVTSTTDQDDSTGVINYNSVYFQHYILQNGNPSYYNWFGLCRSAQYSSASFTGLSATVQPSVDGRNTINTFSQAVNVNSGTANSVNATGAVHAHKLFELSCTCSGTTVTIADTRGIHANREVILVDSNGDEEKVVVNSVTTDTSFSIKQALQVITDINVVSVKYPGLHSLKVTNGAAANLSGNAFEWEPMELSPSNIFKRINAKSKLETVSQEFRGVSNGDPIFAPYHADGIQQSYDKCNIDVVGVSDAATYWNFTDGFRSVNITGGGTINVKLSSSKMIKDLDGMEVF